MDIPCDCTYQQLDQAVFDFIETQPRAIDEVFEDSTVMAAADALRTDPEVPYPYSSASIMISIERLCDNGYIVWDKPAQLFRVSESLPVAA